MYMYIVCLTYTYTHILIYICIFIHIFIYSRKSVLLTKVFLSMEDRALKGPKPEHVVAIPPGPLVEFGRRWQGPAGFSMLRLGLRTLVIRRK